MTEPVTPDNMMVIEDPPSPNLPNLQQRTEISVLPSVPVRIDGPILVQPQPARQGRVTTERLNAKAIKILDADERRQSATLISSAFFYISNKSTAAACPIPGNVVWPIHHAGEVWAKVDTNLDQVLTVQTEWYAQ